jgi:hypothetical protein
MSQNDYTIANQTTPLFRADLNNALQALASNSSGATAPTTTYANMTWYDTGTNTLYMRSEADDAWIALGTLNQSTNTFTPAGSLTLASQAEAEAGTDNTKVMTPLRVAQSIVANAPSPPPALQASSSVSINQNTNYLNSLGRPVFVFASCYYDTINTRSLALQIDYGAGLVEVSRTTTSTGSSHTVCGVVPDGATYRVNGVTTNQTQFNAREFR